MPPEETDFSKVLMKLFTMILDEEIARTHKQRHAGTDPIDLSRSPPPLSASPRGSSTNTNSTNTQSSATSQQSRSGETLFGDFPSYGNRHCDLITNKIEEVNLRTCQKMREIYDARLAKETELHNQLMADLTRIMRQGEERLAKLMDKLPNEEPEAARHQN